MDIKSILSSQLTLAGSKLAADTMVGLITPLGLSVLAILWSLGKTKKTVVYTLIHRDWTTVAHTMTTLINRGYVAEDAVSHTEKYLSLTTTGYEIYTQFICEAADKPKELEALMPKTHVA